MNDPKTPWRRHTATVTNAGTGITKKYSHLIDCDGNPLNMNDGLGVANAELMSAAPELLEAVEMALDLNANGLIDFKKYGLTCDADIGEKYSAAIAKAKGTTNQNQKRETV